jgi:predicted secreted hydrolase
MPQLHIQQAAYTLGDLSDHSFHFGHQGNIPGDPAPVTNGFSLHGPHSSAVGGGGHDVLQENVDGYTLKVSVHSRRPPVLQFGDGYTTLYCNGGFYYQRQRMAVRGTLVSHGKTLEVTGLAWADHQWGFTPAYQVAQSDYFQFQLDDGTDMYLALLRAPPSLDAALPLHWPDAAQGIEEFGSIADKRGNLVMLHPGDFTLTPTAYYRPSPACSYPVAFDVTIAGRHFHVQPTIPTAEVRSTAVPLNNVLWAEDPTFWDGETKISGAGTGLGWLGLVRYCLGR